jgi:hypothetical protein
MRLKRVPEPPVDLNALEAYQRAVPLVPGDTDDCCARLRDRRGLADRQVANDWLAFLRMLGLVRETPRGFVRADIDPTVEVIQRGLHNGVVHTPAALELLREATPTTPVTPESLFTATRADIPRHNRARDPSWEQTWVDRAGRLLGWLALVDLATPIDGRVPVSPAYVAGHALESGGSLP